MLSSQGQAGKEDHTAVNLFGSQCTETRPPLQCPQRITDLAVGPVDPDLQKPWENTCWLIPATKSMLVLSQAKESKFISPVTTASKLNLLYRRRTVQLRPTTADDMSLRPVFPVHLAWMPTLRKQDFRGCWRITSTQPAWALVGKQ